MAVLVADDPGQHYPKNLNVSRHAGEVTL